MSYKASWSKLPPGDSFPEPRWGHSSCCVGACIVVFGGTGLRSKAHNDIHFFDTTRTSWNRPQVSGVIPSGRYGHSANTLPDGRILIFGGRGNSKHYNDVNIFDPQQMAWVRSIAAPKKDFPDARAGHTAVLNAPGTHLVVFGGINNHQKHFNNIFLFDLVAGTWSSPPVHGEPPPVRGGHSAFVFENFMYVFGGYDGKRYYNDVFCLNLENFHWNKVETTGHPPKVRSGHSGSLIGNQLVVFGGCGSDTNFLNDLYLLNITERRWSQPSVAGFEPQPRFRHTCTLVGDSHMYLFAGTGPGSLLGDTCLLELSLVASPPFSTSPSSSINSQSPSLRIEPQSSSATITNSTNNTTTTTTTTTTTSEAVDLRKLYLAAMTTMKAEKQQRLDMESMCIKLEHKLAEAQSAIVREKPARQVLEAKLMEESEKRAKLEVFLAQEKETRVQLESKKKKTLDKSLRKSEQEHATMLEQARKQTEDVRVQNLALSQALSHSNSSKELVTEEFKKAEVKWNVQISALTAEFNHVKAQLAAMQGEALDTLSLEELRALEAKHTIASRLITNAKQSRFDEVMNKQKRDVENLTSENQRLSSQHSQSSEETARLQSTIALQSTQVEELMSERAKLSLRTSQLEGNQLSALTDKELRDLEHLHHEGLRRVSAAREDQRQKEISELRREREALQDRQFCIICTERPNNCVLLPCRHTAMCTQCCELITKCPICRCDITGRMETFH